LKIKDEIIKIVILCSDFNLGNRLKEGINKESNFFKQDTEIILDMNDLNKFEHINLLIFLIDEKMSLKYCNFKRFYKCVERDISIDLDKCLVRNNYNNTSYEIGKKFDERAIAFSILFDYYTDLEKKGQRR